MGNMREEIKRKLREQFDGRIVRKDLTKKIKEGANVPVYVLEFLLGQYCSSDDDAIIESGVQQVKRILADESILNERGRIMLEKLQPILYDEEEGLYLGLGDKITDAFRPGVEIMKAWEAKNYD